MISKEQDDAPVVFTVIETVSVEARATISRAEFKQVTGMPLDQATEGQIADFLVTSNIAYEESGLQERLEDPIFSDIRL